MGCQCRDDCRSEVRIAEDLGDRGGGRPSGFVGGALSSEKGEEGSEGFAGESSGLAPPLILSGGDGFEDRLARSLSFQAKGPCGATRISNEDERIVCGL